jgi:hypothetical protein
VAMSGVNGMKISVYTFLFLTLFAGSPALAQVDLSGEWSPNRAHEDQTPRPNVLPGDYAGMPINDNARARADAWTATRWTLPEWQCRPHPLGYLERGPSELKIWQEIDPVSRETVAIHTEWLRSVDYPIYMDGRPHPSENAPHSWGGFSSGEWIGDVLKISTTHLKEGYMRRSGVFRSDKSEITQFLTRRGNVLTYTSIIYDPAYLEEPLIRSREYLLDLNQRLPPYPCTVVTEVDMDPGVVPHYLPGTNPTLGAFASYYDIPIEASRGGAETMYPEYRKKLKEMTDRPFPRPLRAIACEGLVC